MAGTTTGRHPGTPTNTQCRPLYSSRGRVRPYRCANLFTCKWIFVALKCKCLMCAGELASVEGTPFDFRSPCLIEERFRDVPGDVGYDTNYVLNTHPCHPDDNSLHKAAKCASPVDSNVAWQRIICVHVCRLQDPSTGICLEVFTNQPCVQLYMGGYLDSSLTGKNGKPIGQFHGVCLETQKHPDAVNKVWSLVQHQWLASWLSLVVYPLPIQPTFPTTILREGERYFNKTAWKFTWNWN